MKMAMHNTVPPEIVRCIETLEKAGFEAYLVGGCVRDLLLGREPQDWDITTNATPDQIQALYPKTVYENTFGTVAVIDEVTENPTLKSVEITPYRLESGYSDQRHPDQVKFSNDIKDDLKRRDFTINAIALNLSNGAIKDIIDLYGGFQDLKDKTIRTVGDADSRFNEDGLRIMRAVRLATQLDFTIEKTTYSAIVSRATDIKRVAMERIRDEFEKIILSDNPKQGIELLHKTHILEQFLPELEAGIGVSQNQAHSYDVWEHLLRTLQHAADKKWPLEVRLSALFHDIAKPKTKDVSRETEIVTFYNHELIGSRETQKIMNRLRFPSKLTETVVKLVRWHMFFSDTDVVSLSAVRRMIVNVGRENIWNLMNLRACDRIGTGRPKENPYRLRKYKAMIEEALRDPISVGMLKIDGKEIMEITKTPAGPKIGHILNALLEEVLDNPKLNTKETLSQKAIEFSVLDESKLQELGNKGREKREVEDNKLLEEIRKKHHVS